MSVRPLKRSSGMSEQFSSAILDSLSEAVVVVDHEQVTAGPRAGDRAGAAVRANVGHAPLTRPAAAALNTGTAREPFFNGLRSFRRS